MNNQQAAQVLPKTYPLGDSAIVLHFGETIGPEIQDRISEWSTFIEMHPLPGIIEAVPGYTTLTVFYNPWIVSEKGRFDAYEKIESYLLQALGSPNSSLEKTSRQMEIPVCYGGKYGPDLELVAQHNQLSPKEVISIHTQNEYLVYMIGFAPGFPYLGGMDRRIASPRKSNPRLKIPQGSVGIAGEQTGIYPIETPGGWQLIGRCPLRLFNPKKEQPSLLQAGDRLRFVSISEEEFEKRRKEQYGA